MIKQFPLFSKLSLDHQEEIVNFTRDFKPYSDFNFTSLLCWDTDSSAGVSWLNDNLVIRIPDYLTGDPVYSILGINKLSDSIEKLLNLTPVLKFIPEIVVENLHANKYFTVIEDRDNFDYIYELSSLAHLPGGDFKKKRNKVYGFQKAFSEQPVLINSKRLTPSDAAQLQKVFFEWSSAPLKQKTEEIESEYKAFLRLMEYSASFDIELTKVMINDQVVAFSLNETLNEDYVLCHFEKAIPVHQEKNIYTFLTHHASKTLLQKGCKYINWEQDLGMPGLRKSKMSYKPVGFLKKYLVKAS